MLTCQQFIFSEAYFNEILLSIRNIRIKEIAFKIFVGEMSVILCSMFRIDQCQCQQSLFFTTTSIILVIATYFLRDYLYDF